VNLAYFWNAFLNPAEQAPAVGSQDQTAQSLPVGAEDAGLIGSGETARVLARAGLCRTD
jgi:hypothetical protein